MEDKTMLFDYLEFLEELRTHQNPEKRKIIERWEKLSTAHSIEKEPYYEYLKKFTVNDIPYKIPDELSGDFDWQLLFQLVAASFSSNYQLSYTNSDDVVDQISENELPELCISVSSGNASTTKKVSELYAFQILRLYEIYLEEQINLHALRCQDSNEINGIDCERKLRLKKFNDLKNSYLLRKYTNEQKNIRSKILSNVHKTRRKTKEI